jgi:sterol desaturase/sphingolipid hydroxylase (fatty acid hydroxylase superfamily)
MPNPFGHEHTRHHSEGDYFAPTWKKALVSLVAVPVIGALVALGVGPALGLVYAVAFVSMYATYEWLHRRMHTHRGVGGYGRFVRRHHFHHHFGNPRTNHGVTSPIWDLLFGTYEAPGRIRVPAKLKMSWLVDESTGEVVAELAPFYELRRAA